MVETDKHTWRRKTRCSTEAAQRKMNRPINSGKRVDGVDRVDRFSVELSRFVRLDRFQGLNFTRWLSLKNCVRENCACAVTWPWVRGESDYIFRIPDPDLPVYYTTSIGLRHPRHSVTPRHTETHVTPLPGVLPSHRNGKKWLSKTAKY